jgi:hypothetical protein
VTGQLEQHGVYVLFVGGVLVLCLVLAAAAVHEVLFSAAPSEPPTPPAFVCPSCGARSWHPEDGRQGWCGHCKAFTGRPDGLDIPTDRRTA